MCLLQQELRRIPQSAAVDNVQHGRKKLPCGQKLHRFIFVKK